MKTAPAPAVAGDDVATGAAELATVASAVERAAELSVARAEDNPPLVEDSVAAAASVDVSVVMDSVLATADSTEEILAGTVAVLATRVVVVVVAAAAAAVDETPLSGVTGMYVSLGRTVAAMLEEGTEAGPGPSGTEPTGDSMELVATAWSRKKILSVACFSEMQDEDTRSGRSYLGSITRTLT